jgi:hypothetical protein
VKIKKAKVKSSTAIKPKKNITVIVILGLVAIAVAALIFLGLSSVFKTTTYYVLRSDVAAKTQITTNMLVGQQTSAGTQPKNALSIQQVQAGNMYAKYALEKGDVISRSNVGALKQSTAGIPDTWVVTSFQEKGSDSVDGRIERGTYFDIIGIKKSGDRTTSRYLFTDVLALDVNSSVSGDAKDSAASYTYTVGMPQKNVALLHAALKEYDTIKLVLSPKSIDYEKRDTKDLGKLQSYKDDNDPANIDLYKDTDSTFKEVKRDKNGKPITKKSKKSSTTSSTTDSSSDSSDTTTDSSKK